MDNIQHILNRVRSPRVQITYDVETNGAKVIKEIPYIMAIFSDVKGHSTKNIPYNKKKFYQLTGQNINNLMDFFDVRVKTNGLKFGSTDEYISMDIPLHNINDFSPDNLIENLALLKNLKNNLCSLKDLKRKLVSNNTFVQSLLVETNGTNLKNALLDKKSTDNDSKNQEDGQKKSSNGPKKN